MVGTGTRRGIRSASVTSAIVTAGCGCGSGVQAGSVRTPRVPGVRRRRAVADEADDVGEGGVVAELELVVAFDAEAFADEGEDLGLFDGVDAEVGFEVEVEVEHVGGVAGLVGHHGEDLGLDVQVAATGPAAGGVGAGSGLGLDRRGLVAGAVPAGAVAARSRTKPMTWARVG